jgi:polyadenylation factor subunit 2
MRDKYNLNTLPPSLAGLEDYEMDEHVMIPGMGGMNEDRGDYGEAPINLNDPPQISSNIHPQVVNGAIPGLDLDVSSVRDRKQVPSVTKPPPKPQESWNSEQDSDLMFGITAHDPASILTCVRDVIAGMVKQLPGIVQLSSLKPEKIQIYGKEVDVIRKCFEIGLKFF